MAVQETNDDIDLVYQEIISPENFIQNFDSKEEFILWLEKGTKKDLEFNLERFEEQEMYEQCSIIRDFINKKFTDGSTDILE
jgi:hypothetical protein